MNDGIPVSVHLSPRMPYGLLGKPRPILMPSERVAFDPASIGDLFGWWDASDISTLGPTSSGPGIVQANGPVKYLGDKSGNGWHLFQTGADSASPTLLVSGLGGKSGLSFDGSDDQLFSSNTTPRIDQPYTIFAAVDIVNTAVSKFIFGCQDRGFYAIITEAIQAYAGGAPTMTTTATGNTRAAIAVKVTPGVGGDAIWLGDSAAATTGTVSDTNLLATGNERLRLGATNTPNRFFSGRIYEIALFTSALSDSAILTMQRYLLAKYAI